MPPFWLINLFATPRARPGAQQLWRRAEGVLGGGAGHDLRLFAPVPMYVARGAGCRKWDVDGHEYIDFLCGNGALLVLFFIISSSFSIVFHHFFIIFSSEFIDFRPLLVVFRSAFQLSNSD